MILHAQIAQLLKSIIVQACSIIFCQLPIFSLLKNQMTTMIISKLIDWQFLDCQGSCPKLLIFDVITIFSDLPKYKINMAVRNLHAIVQIKFLS